MVKPHEHANTLSPNSSGLLLEVQEIEHITTSHSMLEVALEEFDDNDA